MMNRRSVYYFCTQLINNSNMKNLSCPFPFPDDYDEKSSYESLNNKVMEICVSEMNICLEYYDSERLTLNAFKSIQFSCSVVSDSGTTWTAACQASLSITNSWHLLKGMSIKSVMPSNLLNLCRPLLLPSIFPSIRVFSNESVLHIR